MVRALGLQDRVLCTVYTFGKAMGYHGAVVCGSQILKDYLINYSRPFIYSTSLPPHSVAAIKCIHQYCLGDDVEEMRRRLLELIDFFAKKVQGEVIESLDSLEQGDGVALLETSSPIQAIILPGNERVVTVATM